MKSTHRIPTNQFAYIEIEFEGSEDEIVAKHKEFLALYAGGEGVPPKEFNAALDGYLAKGTGNLELYQRMSPAQQQCFQEIKKSFARIKNRLDKPVIN